MLSMDGCLQRAAVHRAALKLVLYQGRRRTVYAHLRDFNAMLHQETGVPSPGDPSGL